jgi:very-short-patch-repair endonuclease
VAVFHREMGRLRVLLRRQHSVITRPQLLALGFTSRVIERRLEAGRLVPLHQGVYLAGAVASPLAHDMAAVLACAPASYSSHSSASHIWSLTPHMPKPERPEVTVVGRDPRRPGVRVHRVQALPRTDTTTHKQIPITTPARTLLDLAPTLEPRQLEQALAEALRRRLVRPPTLHSLLARHPGRPGVPALRRLLDSGEPAHSRSELEERFLALLRDADLPAPEVNAQVGPYEIDFLWRDQRLALETDGWDFHSDRTAFEQDRRRDAELVARGYRVIRVTWRQLAEEPIAVVARLAAALAV